MPYKLSRPMRRRIRELYAQGWRKQAIAHELSISRDSVRKYCAGVDAEVSLSDAPAARLTAAEVDKLQALTSLVRLTTCEIPGCGAMFAVPNVRPQDRSGMDYLCPKCGELTCVTITHRLDAPRTRSRLG